MTVADEKAAQILADSNIDIFDCRMRFGENDVIVEPGQFRELQALGLPYRYIGPLPRLDPFSLGRPEGAPFDYLTDYLRYDEVIQLLEHWRQQWPALIEREEIGQSIQKRPIWAYRLRNPAANPSKSMVFHGGIHAREWISVPVALHMFERLLREALGSASGWRLISEVEFSMVPVVNPDGYEYSWTNTRLWRKNRRNNGNGTFGVDLNRNYSVGWGIGASTNPGSSVYRGTAPFSEPESSAMRDYLDTRTNLIAFIDYHSYGQYVLWPLGYSTDPAPHRELLRDLGEEYRQGILAAGGVNYQNGQASILLSPAGGCTDDYGYETFIIPSYTLELRDRSTFILPPSQILPTALENWAGFKAFILALLKNEFGETLECGAQAPLSRPDRVAVQLRTH